MKIGDVCESVSHTFNKQQKNVILINTSDILDGEVINHKYVPNKNLRGQFKKSFQQDDILYSEIRPKNRRFAYIDFNANDYIASTKLMVIRSKDKILPQFLFQLLKSEDIINQLQSLAETRSGTFPQITFSELAALDICIPTISEQKEIAYTLNTFDEKIANNKKINHHLNCSISETRNSPDIRRGKSVSRRVVRWRFSLRFMRICSNKEATVA